MSSDLIRGWMPVRVKKTRQNKRLEPGSDSIRTEKALEALNDLKLGVDGKGAHTHDEQMYIFSIEPRSRLLHRLYQTLR